MMDMEQVFGVGAQLVVIGGGLAAIYWGIKRWVGDISRNAKTAASQVEPNGSPNKDTTRHIIEDIQSGQVEIIERLDAHDEVHQFNRALADRALALNQQTSERLDAHLRGHA